MDGHQPPIIRSRAPTASARLAENGPSAPPVGAVAVLLVQENGDPGQECPSLLPPQPHFSQETLSGALWGREYELL